MKLMTYYSVLLFALMTSSIAHARTQDPNHGLKKALQATVNQQQTENHLVSLSVSVALPQKGKIIDSTSGFYTLHKNRPITANTLFQIGSITKTFFSVLTLALESKGVLTINDKVGKWTTEFPAWQNITIKQLLNHSSGLFELDHSANFWKNVVANPHKIWTLHELAAFSYQHPLNFKPGTQVAYSNTDYVLLGIILEKANKQPLSKTFNHFFRKKLGLSNTYYLPAKVPVALITQLAHGYNNEGTFPTGTDVTLMTAGNFASAGAVISTPHDVARFIQKLFSGDILPKKQLNEMLTIVNYQNAHELNLQSLPKLKPDKHGFINVGAGLGIGLVYLPNAGFQWMHAGGRLGYEALFAYNPCNHTVVALAYNTRPKSSFIFLKILKKINKILDHFPVNQSKTQEKLSSPLCYTS